MSQILAISKEGNDVVTETDPNNLIFSSEYNTLKYYKSGTIDLAVSGADVEGTVAHNLGYVPFFTSYVNYFASVIDGSLFNMCPGSFQDVGTAYTYVNTYADDTNLYFRVDTNTANLTYTFRYFVFRNDTGL